MKVTRVWLSHAINQPSLSSTVILSNWFIRYPLTQRHYSVSPSNYVIMLTWCEAQLRWFHVTPYILWRSWQIIASYFMIVILPLLVMYFLFVRDMTQYEWNITSHRSIWWRNVTTTWNIFSCTTRSERYMNWVNFILRKNVWKSFISRKVDTINQVY